jgi:hypothetical protein
LLRKAPGEEEVLKWLELAAGEIEGWVSTPSREDRTSGTPV